MADYSTFDASIQELNRSTANLNSASDVLTTAIENCNALLKSIGPGVSAWVVVRRTEKDIQELGYAKANGHWCLVYRSCDLDHKPLHETLQPLKDVARYIRIDALAHLTELIDKIRQNADELAIKCIQRAGEIRAILSPYVPVTDYVSVTEVAEWPAAEEKCSHERLNEDGICCTCGLDCRSGS